MPPPGGFDDSIQFAVTRVPAQIAHDLIRAGDQHGWVAEHAPPEADAIVIAGNGFRAVGAIAALEEDLGRPAVTANQALLWGALRAAGADPGSISGYGRLFGQS